MKYSKREAAEYLGIPLTTLQFHIKERHIKTELGTVKDTNRPGHWIDESDLIAFKRDYAAGKFGRGGRRRGQTYKKKS